MASSTSYPLAVGIANEAYVARSGLGDPDPGAPCPCRRGPLPSRRRKAPRARAGVAGRWAGSFGLVSGLPWLTLPTTGGYSSAKAVRAALSAPLSELCPALATPVRCSTGTAWADVCSRPRWQPFTGGRGVLLCWGDVSTLAGGGAYGEQRARTDVAWSA